MIEAKNCKNNTVLDMPPIMIQKNKIKPANVGKMNNISKHVSVKKQVNSAKYNSAIIYE